MTDDSRRGDADLRQSIPVAGQSPRTSGKAIASLILGLLSLVCLCSTGILAIILGIQGLRDTRHSNGRLTGRGLAIAGIVLGSIGSLLTIGYFLQGVGDFHGARRSQSRNSLKQVALALLMYDDSNHRFPTAFSRDEDGRPLLSWRVAILPYLEEGMLEKRFDQNEPWDGPDNKLLADLCPALYKSPGDRANPGTQTNILGIVDADTVLSADGSVTMRDIKDGASNTIVAVELAGAEIVWSEPRDITIDELLAAMRRGVNEPGLRPVYPGGVLCFFADGSVQFIPTDVAPATLRGLCTRSGHEAVTVPFK